MDDIEINRRLALAIGYKWWGIKELEGRIFVNRKDFEFETDDVVVWSIFDHQNWHTIGPIMERYRVFPEDDRGGWVVTKRFESGVSLVQAWHTCPRTCAALAVIEAHERGLL